MLLFKKGGNAGKRSPWAKHMDRKLDAKECGQRVKVKTKKNGKRSVTEYTENRKNRCD